MAVSKVTGSPAFVVIGAVGQCILTKLAIAANGQSPKESLPHARYGGVLSAGAPEAIAGAAKRNDEAQRAAAATRERIVLFIPNTYPDARFLVPALKTAPNQNLSNST